MGFIGTTYRYPRILSELYHGAGVLCDCIVPCVRNTARTECHSVGHRYRAHPLKHIYQPMARSWIPGTTHSSILTWQPVASAPASIQLRTLPIRVLSPLRVGLRTCQNALVYAGLTLATLGVSRNAQ